jgi:AP-2 complex subunit mu-1
VIDGTSFLWVRHKDMFFVAVTRSNGNAALIFSFLYAMLDIFKGYFEEDFDEDAIRDNFTLVYELLDEILDYGYPQNCALDVLKMYINLGSVRQSTSAAADKQMTSAITGARDWRREGIVHKKNEVFIDVDESVNLLVSSNGTVLKNDVSGKIVMKALLTGMPECKLGLNDKVVLDRDGAGGKGGGAAAAAKKKAAGVDIDDCTFHRCVQLGKFDADRTITFVPPDGEFELMKYRITENVNLPFRIIPVIEEQGKTRVVMNIKAIANFSSQLFATNVAFTIPVRVCLCVCGEANCGWEEGGETTSVAATPSLPARAHTAHNASPHARAQSSPRGRDCERELSPNRRAMMPSRSS